MASGDSSACADRAKNSEFSWNPDNQFVTAKLSRFYSLGDLIESAYVANDFAKVKVLAKENFDLAEIYRCNWNYGNAIHDTNRILGWISLKNGDLNAAADYLAKAGKTTGSPQLDTFGPNLDLANELLQRGKVEAVTAYLIAIKSFWQMDNGHVDIWLSEIGQGGKPALDRFAAVSAPGPFLMFLFWLTIAWPPILAAVFLYTKRARIQKKVLYFIVTALLGYVMMYLANWISYFAATTIIPRIDNANSTAVLTLSFGMLFLLPLLAIFFLTRFFYTPAGDVDTP